MISFRTNWASDSELLIYKPPFHYLQTVSPSDSDSESLSIVSDDIDTTPSDDADSDHSPIVADDNDASPIGGKMEALKLDGTIRISGCNPNGINVKNIENQLQNSVDLEIDIQCYSEVNANLHNSKLRQQFHETVRRMDSNTKATWSTSDVPCDSEFKPGGTGIINRGQTSNRVKSSGNDPLGRWLWQLLNGEGSCEVIIISVYQCCSSNSQNARNTAYRQQQILLSERNRADRDQRSNFKKDISTFIRSMKERNPSLVPIIIGDWNEECTKGSASDELCKEFGLVNIFDRLYPNHPQFKTYQRGSKVIDFALALLDIADRITNFVYEPFLYRIKGDHRAFYFDINENILFGNFKQPPFDPASRGFNSRDVKNAKVYLEKVHEILLEHDIFNRMQRLLRSPLPDNIETEKIDTILTEACEIGEATCRRRRRYHWSIELNKIRRELSIW